MSEFINQQRIKEERSSHVQRKKKQSILAGGKRHKRTVMEVD